MLLQANLHAKQAMVHVMSPYFESKIKDRPNETIINDDSANGDEPACPSKFTAPKAAPLHSWAGCTPGNLFNALLNLFLDLVKGSSTKRQGIITGFFCNLVKENQEPLLDTNRLTIPWRILRSSSSRLQKGTAPSDTMDWGQWHLQYTKRRGYGPAN